MLLRPKYKETWLIKPDNSDAALNIKLYSTHTCINTLKPDLLSSCLHQLQTQPQSFTKPPVLIDTHPLLKATIDQLLKSSYIFLKIFSQHRLSYRGFISYILIIDRKNSYLIDAVTIRNNIDQLRNILADDGIVKFVYDLAQVNFAFKREFCVDVVNGFDLGWIQGQFQCLGKLCAAQQQLLQQQLQQFPQLLTIRPPKQKSLKSLHRHVPLLSSFLPYLPHPTSLPKSLHIYTSTLLQNNHPPSYPPSHQNIHCLSKQQFDNLKPKQQKLYYLLLEFREHVARMFDVNVQVVMPKRVVRRILGAVSAGMDMEGSSGVSVLDVCGMYEEDGVTSADLEICKRIYDVIRLSQQQFQDTQKLHQLFAPQTPASSPDIKKLLKDLQWGNSIQWLNRKDDPSIRLYKQIISINQFDYSVGQEYINKMKGEVFKKGQLNKYLKYAQFMRNKNYQKLENYYKMTLLVKESMGKEEEFSEGGATDGEGKEKGDSKCCRQLFSDKIQTMASLKSTQSLQQKLQQNPNPNPNQPPHSCPNPPSSHTIPSSSSSSTSLNQQHSRKSSDTISFNINDLDQLQIKRSDIRPLPNTIEQIYELAQEVKKKNDRKIKKKDKKCKTQYKKQNDFVPTWDDIQQLLVSYGSNLK